MSNETLRVRLGLIGDTVVMQTTEMPERFRGDFTFTASNGMVVGSRILPDLHKRVIYLPGSHLSADRDVRSRTAKGHRGAQYYRDVKLALKEAKAEMERIMLTEDEPEQPDGTPGFPFNESDVI